MSPSTNAPILICDGESKPEPINVNTNDMPLKDRQKLAQMVMDGRNSSLKVSSDKHAHVQIELNSQTLPTFDVEHII